VVRRIYEFQVRVATGSPPTPSQIEAVNAQQAEIQARFEQMIFNLPEPYASLKLPAVMTTATVLTVT
jgi:hypothetical protein